MTTTLELLSQLRTLDVKVWLEEGRLRYSAPPGAMTPALLGQLAGRKVELIDFLNVTEAAARSGASSLRRAERGGPVPLSFAQQRLWVFDQLGLDPAAYNIPAAFRLRGRLDAAALGRALNEIVRRHEVLRTTFAAVNGRPAQVVAPPAPFGLPVLDLRGAPGGARLEELADEEARRPFDLAAGPPLRLRLLRVADDEHVLLVTIHHIVFDGWSMGLFVREMGALYEAYSSGRPSPLAELPIQYADYAVWQREWLQGEVLKGQLDYWKRRLGDGPPALELPTDGPRPAVQTFRGAQAGATVPFAVYEGLKDLSRRRGTTLFMTLLAAFKALLYRYTGQEDVLVGTPVANRNRGEIEALMGFFGNTLVLRTDLSGDPSFLSLLGRTAETALEAYAHQDIPFEKLVNELQPRRDMSMTPLFQVMFVFDTEQAEEQKIADLSVSAFGASTGTAKFDLTFIIGENERGLSLFLEYNRDLFREETAARMLDHYRVLVEGVVADPRQRISRLPILTPEERGRLSAVGHDGAAEVAQDLSLQKLFEAQVARTPAAVALKCGEESLTYGELNSRANQLAHRLRRLGVGPEVLVGLCVERSIEMVVGLLAVLKAGGAYLPLDPSYPAERLTFMLEDARASVLLTQKHLAGRIPESAARVVLLDGGREEADGESGENPPAVAAADNIAYCIYTSGSTGKPKGTLVSHSNVMRLFGSTGRWFDFDGRDVWTLFHSYAFDFSVWEMWGALLHGGRLVVVPYLVSRSPEAFYDLLVAERVTVLNQTPSAFRQLMRADESLGGGRELSLRLVIFGGEALELQSLGPWFDRHGDSSPRLVNMYGITETTVHVTYRPLTAEDAGAASGSLVGGPIPDLRVHVLDGHLQLVPVGVAGELYVGGAGVARGYLGRPGLTAQRFIPDPLAPRPGARLYRTGDRARRLPNGDIEYLGRLDQQVKIRGFRIELGEIESLLNQHPSVSEAVVVAGGDAGGEKRLVAYVVARPPGPPPVEELRGFLKGKLPDHMLPSAFVMLDRLPLTNNGKVDHRALPEPDRARPELRKVYAAPRTRVERTLADIWAKVLDLERVGVNDNFFDLGGDSIRSIQIRAEARLANLDFSMQQLFLRQTIAELAPVTAGAEAPYSPPAPSRAFGLISEEDARRVAPGIEDAYPLTMLQTGMIFHSTYSPNSSAYHNVSSVRLRAPFDADKLRAALNELASRHPILRTSFELSDFSEPLQLVHRSVEVPLRVADLRHFPHEEQEAEVAAWVDAEREGTFDWASAPLVRFQVHLRTDDTFQFSWAEHHAILDGWSLASMTAELFGLYTSYVEGAAGAVGPPPVSTFRDYVALERAALGSDEARRFWTERLDGETTVMPRWPASRRAGDEDTRQSFVEVPISPETSDRLKRLAREAGVPLKSVLLASHLRVLSLVSGRKEVVTGVISNGRLEEVDGERALGLFLNALPFRLKLGGGTWLELIRGTFEAEQEMLPYRRFPVAELQRMRGGEPLFETTFNYVHFYVYQNLTGLPRVEVLDGKEFADTNYPFKATFVLDPDSSHAQLLLGYKSSELCAEQVEAVSGYYANALAAMLADPSGRYETAPLLPEGERRRLLSGWGDAADRGEPDECIHSLFEAQAARTPGAVALKSAEGELTYGELNERAGLLAGHLRALGVGPDVPVCLLFGRSAEAFVALLGVLKAGGAYVPLDPEFPRERLAFMIEDARAPVLLTLEESAASLPPHGARVVLLDSDWPEIARGAGAPAAGEGGAHAPVVTPRNLAYVIYTSGSTGEPKGVTVEHRSLVNYVRAIAGRLGLGEGAGYALMQPLTVDASLTAVYPPLVTGGCVHVFTKEQTLDARTLADYFGRHRIDCLKLAPSHLAALQAWPEPERLMPRSHLVVGGEPSRYDWVAGLQAMAPGCRILNQYGPTEATVAVLTYLFEEAPDDTRPPATIPAGRPIRNTRVYLLDEEMQPVPVGVRGELYAGGDCLARGYLGRPGLTAERFVPDPFSAEPGARLYRTGDVARYLPDGDIEYLGRLDRQVKIRGFRVETAEVEAGLRQHPSVSEAVVTAREGAAGDRRLVAHFVCRPGAEAAAAELRAFLGDRLPEFMRPAAFVRLDALPLTRHGKVDFGALPDPEEVSRPETRRAPVAPLDELEAHLVRIWEESLGTRPVGVTDSFFELGGDSITAVRLMARVQKQFGRNLPLSTLFAGATVEAMARILRARGRDGAPYSPLVEIQGGGTRPPFFCVHPVGGNVFCYYELANTLKPDQPFYALQARGLEDGQAPLSSVEEMAASYVGAVRARQPAGPYYLGGWSVGGVVAFEMARQLSSLGEEVALLALIDSRAPSPGGAPALDDAELLSEFFLDLCRTRGAEAADLPDTFVTRLRRSGPRRRVEHLLGRARREGVLPPDADASEVGRLFETFKSTHHAVRAYSPPRADCRPVLFRAGQEEDGGGGARGWEELARSVEVRAVNGDHYTLLRPPHVAALADAIKSYIEQPRDVTVTAGT